MGLARELRRPLADGVPGGVGEHAADPWVGIGAADGALSQLQRAMQ